MCEVLHGTVLKNTRGLAERNDRKDRASNMNVFNFDQFLYVVILNTAAFA